ncbi:MAG: hypothetical protein R2731_19145 [Nocardioides sp.]
MIEVALLEVRALPWRPRARVMSAERFREGVADVGPFDATDGLEGLVVGLGLWLALILLAPVVVVVIAVLLLPVELVVVAALAALLLLARFAGAIPWTVLTISTVSGEESTTRHRFLPAAVRQVRKTNHDRRVRVRWSWT